MSSLTFRRFSEELNSFVGKSVSVTTTDGKELFCHASESSNGKTTYHFACPREKVANIVWLSRPYEWGTMQGVMLKPKAAPAK